MEEGLLKATGKDLNHWKKVVQTSGLKKHGEILKMLKSDYGFTHGFANFVSLKSRESDAGSHNADDLIENQYKGKENLVPIYEQLDKFLRSLGSDITVTPKKDSVSYIRKHQFALVKPATKKRVDLGLKIKGQENSGKLQGSGPFGAMCTHRIVIETVEEIDEEVKSWITEAYNRSV